MPINQITLARTWQVGPYEPEVITATYTITESEFEQGMTTGKALTELIKFVYGNSFQKRKERKENAEK